MPPIGCSPAVRILVNNGSTCFEEFSAIARLHNNALSKRLHELEKQLKGFKYSVMDFYSAFSQVFNNPTKYGMTIDLSLSLYIYTKTKRSMHVLRSDSNLYEFFYVLKQEVSVG